MAGAANFKVTADEFQQLCVIHNIGTPEGRLLELTGPLEDMTPEKRVKAEDFIRTMKLSFFALGIGGEGGEVMDKVKKGVRGDYDLGNIDEDRRKAIGLELGDDLWYIANMAAELGYNLTDIMQMNVDKLADRRARGKSRGDGDNR